MVDFKDEGDFFMSIPRVPKGLMKQLNKRFNKETMWDLVYRENKGPLYIQGFCDCIGLLNEAVRLQSQPLAPDKLE